MEAIRKYRIKMGYSQARLAELVGTTQAAVAMWEASIRMPRTDKLPILAKVLACSVEDLFAESNKEALTNVNAAAQPHNPAQHCD